MEGHQGIESLLQAEMEEEKTLLLTSRNSLTPCPSPKG